MRVVEPSEYNPAQHAQIFEKVLTDLVSPQATVVGPYSNEPLRVAEEFDLVTFPEAFAPAASLLEVLKTIGALPALGCVHVGLRPSGEKSQHLFSVAQLTKLLAELKSLPSVVLDDLVVFEQWLLQQQQKKMFNLACLFTLDEEQRIRVCLTPKGVRSRDELSVLPDHTMEEANMLTLVTLVPDNRKFLTITLQPLICADVLKLTTDRGTSSLLEEVNKNTDLFDAPPDHIDIVSVATCTPQPVCRARSGGSYREWHQNFRAAFLSTAEDAGLERHRFATFVLANFTSLLEGKPGGLSGLFEPINARTPSIHSDVILSCYGRVDIKLGNDRWSTPGDDPVENDDVPVHKWANRAYLAGLGEPARGTAYAVRIFGFTLSSLLRDQTPWKPRQGATSWNVSMGRRIQSGDLMFSDSLI